MNRQRKWEKRWREADYEPRWRLHEPPEPVVRAVEEGWWAPGMSVLDVGCGAGEIAAWLAGKGLRALGVDFSPSAIERARRTLGGTPGLRLEIADVCRPGAVEGRFDALLDRGCLQGLLEEAELSAAYAANVASWASPGCRFLLLVAYRDHTPEERLSAVRGLLEDAFELLEVAETSMEGPRARNEIPGAALRLVRRPAPQA